MKKLILLLFLTLLNINGVSINSHAEYSHEKPLEIEYVNPEIEYVNPEIEYSVKNLLAQEMQIVDVMNIVHDEMIIDKINVLKYKEFLAERETGKIPNPYLKINRFGYAGKYQFGKSTLRTLHKVKLIDFDIDKEGRSRFLSDSILQEKALNALIIYNLNYAKNKNLLKYVGKKYHGVTITIEGILAGSHLVGVRAVRHFLENNGSLDDFYIRGVK